MLKTSGSPAASPATATATDVWKAFCRETLEFEIPEYEPIEVPEPAAEAAVEDQGSGGGASS